MNETNYDSIWNPSDQFEQLLKACQPDGGNRLEQMLYQAGWQAALAHVTQSAQDANIGQVAYGPKLARTNRRASISLKWFGSGLGIGLAVSLLGVVLGLKLFDSARAPALTQAERTSPTKTLEAGLGSHTREQSFAIDPNSDHSPDAFSPSQSFDRPTTSFFAWSELFISPTRVRDLRLPIGRHHVSRAHVGRGDLDWEFWSSRDRYQDTNWREVPTAKSDDYPPSKAIYSRPLTEAQIKELL